MKGFRKVLRKLSVFCVGMILLFFLFEDKVVVAATTNEVVDSSQVVHNHTGSSGSSGGCYTTPAYTNYGTTTRTENVTCGASYGSGVATGNTIGGQATYKWTCSKGHTYIGWYCPSGCGTVVGTRNVTKCNKCGSSGCNGRHQNGYSLSCGYSNGDIVGTYNLVKNVSDTYTLSISYTGKAPSSYSWSTGATGSSISVTSDGTYKCTMQVNDGISTKSVSVSYTVSDYDKTPPVISGITRNTARTQSPVTIKVTASDNIGVTDYKLDSR